MSRRVALAMEVEGAATISAFQDRVLHDVECMDRFIGTLAVHVTSMFRDPEFYKTLRKKVIPMLRTYPFIRIWIAGCSSGEEVYSTAIVLKEENVYDRCRIYATDFSDVVLKRAQEGIFPLKSMKEYTESYLKSGGEKEFSNYYTAKYGNARFKKSLMENVTFSEHNLALDKSFNEFNLILCRNVMIYFAKPLQEHVLGLFDESLCRLGILGLGKKESLHNSKLGNSYSEIEESQRLFQKLR